MKQNFIIDESEGLYADDGRIQAMLSLTDNELKELAKRTTIFQSINASFDEMLSDDETLIEVWLDFYPERELTATLRMQSDRYGWTDYIIPIDEQEEAALWQEVRRVALNEMFKRV